MSVNEHKSLRVLLVEDNPADSDLIQEYADQTSPRRLSFQVATTLHDARKFALEHPFDAILLDLGLPDSCGLETLEAVVEAGLGVPIIVLTGDQDTATGYDCIERGAHDYLVKGRVEKFITEAVHNSVARAEVQKELKAAHDNIKQMLSDSPDAIVVIDSDSVVVFANQAASDLLGPKVRLHQPFELELPSEAEEIHLEGADGKNAVVDFTTSQTTWYGSPAKVINLRDITARKEVHARLKLALTSANIGLFDFSFEDNKAHFSVECGLMLGYNDVPSEMTLEQCLTFVHPDEVEEWTQKTEESLNAGPEQEASFETRLRDRDGNYRWINLRGRVVDSKDGRPVRMLGCLIDNTERRQVELQLAQSDRLASMGMIAAGVAHEINNPLTHVLLSLEQLQLQSDHLKFEEEALEYLDSALKGSYRIRDIARDLGSFSRVEDDKLDWVSVNDVTTVALNLARKELEYRARIDSDLQPTPLVRVNEGRLCQVILNLLINAAHCIPEGDVENQSIRVSTHCEGDEVWLKVQDTGSGISSDNVSRLFDPFFTTKEIGEGSGLGLAISKTIVESFEGRIDVESEIGVGSVFTVRLPYKRTSATAKTSATVSEPSGHGRILVVDDEKSIRFCLRRLLRDYQIVLAESGLEARKILEKDQDFDIVLTDLMMPKLSGMELHEWVVSNHPKLASRVIFMTGGAFTPHSRSYLTKVSNLRLDKPFDRKQLFDAIHRSLRSSSDDD